MYFENHVSHISKLGSELGDGPELVRFTGSVNATVTYESSNPEVVTVTKVDNTHHTLHHNGGYGTVVISATQPAKNKYTAGYASYELTVQKPMDVSFIVDNSVRVPDDLTVGDPYMPMFKLKDENYYMQEGHDFTVSYRNTSNNKISTIPPSNSGTYEILFTGMDIYNGTISGGTFSIRPLDMADAGYTIDDIPDVHGIHVPNFVLRRNGVEISHDYIGTPAQNGMYAQEYESVMSTWQPGSEHTLTISALHVPNVGGTLTKKFYYSYEGNGTQSNPYKISSTALFNYLAQEVNSGNDMKGLYFQLTADIDAPAATIGSIEKPFAGVFDGNNKIITNATKAIFGRLTSDATVKNFKVVGTAAETGAIALWNEGTMQNNYFHSTNTTLNGLAGNSGSGNTETDGAVRVYKVAYNADDMTCTMSTTATIAYNNAKYYKANTTVNVKLAKKGHESDMPTFYLNIGSLTNAAAGNTGENSLTVTTNDIDINVAYTPFIQNGWISIAQESFQYDGTEKKPMVTVNNGSDLIADTDYTVEYENNINAGTAKVVVKGKGTFTGEAVKTFTITPRADADVAMEAWYEIHTVPEPVVTCPTLNTTLVKDQDYVLTRCLYNNTPSLENEYAELTIQFVGNYSDQVTKQYKTHYWKGEGTAEDPFQITNSRQLVYLSEESNAIGPRVKYLEAHFKVMNDIDMEGVSFRPISDRNEGEVGNFFGTFDGNNKVISNLTISEGKNATGLFGRNYAGTLQNIILKDVTASVNDPYKPTALLVGTNRSTVKNCVVLGVLPADSKVKYAITDYNNTSSELSLVNNYYHVDGNDDVRGTGLGDVLTNNGAVGLFNFTLSDGVTATDVNYSEDAYDIFGTYYHKNGATATMKLAYTGTLENPMFYAENGELVDNGNGTYTLTFDGPAKIIATKGLDMADAEITLSETEYTFEPIRTEGFEPTVTVTYDGKALVKDVDYDLAYSDNLNAGSATVTVTGKRMYTGSKKTSFSIAPYDLSKAGVNDLTVGLLDNGDIKYDIPNIFFEGENTVKPTIGVDYNEWVPNTGSWNSVRLVEGEDKDFTITYTKAEEVGTAYVTVNGKGNYIGSRTKEYTITDQDLTKCTFTCLDIPSDEYGYYGDALLAALKGVSPIGNELIYPTDFNVSDEQAINLYGAYGTGDWLEAGHQYQVKVEGQGLWSGTQMVTFNIIDRNNLPAQTLYDDQKNDDVLGVFNSKTVPSVTFSDRVFYKDGDWNTICLPFSLTKAQLAASPLAGCTLMEMNSDDTSFDQTTGALTLTFDNVNTAPANDDDNVIWAGVPYLIKWDKPNEYVAYDGTNAGTCSDIVNPVFENVFIINSMKDVTSSDYAVTFRGTFNPLHLYDDPHTRYYLGANNTLFYPKNSFVQFNAFRGYFEIDLGSWASQSVPAPVFHFNFGDNTTSITTAERVSDENAVWYSLDGRKLQNKPTTKGLYIMNGKKIVIK